jgi:hypothetical protein
MIEKLADQAAQIALLKDAKLRALKHADEMVYLCDQLINLRIRDEAKMNEELDSIESLVVEEDADLSGPLAHHSWPGLLFLHCFSAVEFGRQEGAQGQRI